MRDTNADRAKWKELSAEYDRLAHLARVKRTEVMSSFNRVAKGRGPGPTDDDLTGLEMLERDLERARAATDAHLKEVFG